jgi:hypothetical protein
MKFLKAIIALTLLSLTLAAPLVQRRDTGDVFVRGDTLGSTTERRGDTGTGTDDGFDGQISYVSECSLSIDLCR